MFRTPKLNLLDNSKQGGFIKQENMHSVYPVASREMKLLINEAIC